MPVRMKRVPHAFLARFRLTTRECAYESLFLLRASAHLACVAFCALNWMSKEHSAPVDFRNAFLSTKRVPGILARLRLLRSPTAGSNPRNQHAGGTDGGRSLPCFPGGIVALWLTFCPLFSPVYIHNLSSTG